MAHLVETMAYAGETPWHGLGVPVSNDLTADQMLKKAGLDWTIYKVPGFAEISDDNGEKTRVALSKSALIRSTDNVVLDEVSNDWEPVQNHDAFEFFAEFVDAGHMEMHTAGSLDGGRMVWGLAKVNESFDLFGGDQVDSYLLFSNPHRYGKSIDIRFTPIRVVCNNTLSLSLSQNVEMSVKYTHRKAFDPELAKEALGIASNKLNTYKSMAKFLGSKKATPNNIVEYFKTVFPSTNKDSDATSRPAQRALDVLETQPGAKFAEGSWWQPFNAVTYLIDHSLGHHADTRLQSAWYGVNKNKKIKALELAVEMAEVA